MWFGLHNTPRGSTDVKPLARMHISSYLMKKLYFRGELSLELNGRIFHIEMGKSEIDGNAIYSNV